MLIWMKIIKQDKARKIKLKNDFKTSVKSYKEIERQKTFSLIQDNFDNSPCRSTVGLSKST